MTCREVLIVPPILIKVVQPVGCAVMVGVVVVLVSVVFGSDSWFESDGLSCALSTTGVLLPLLILLAEWSLGRRRRLVFEPDALTYQGIVGRIRTPRSRVVRLEALRESEGRWVLAIDEGSRTWRVHNLVECDDLRELAHAWMTGQMA